MLSLDGQKTSCCYQLCTEGGGHSVCTVVEDHYERLCKAAQSHLDAPSEGTAADLQDVLNETTGVDR